jgi:hypothetical protein
MKHICGMLTNMARHSSSCGHQQLAMNSAPEEANGNSRVRLSHGVLGEERIQMGTACCEQVS